MAFAVFILFLGVVSANSSLDKQFNNPSKFTISQGSIKFKRPYVIPVNPARNYTSLDLLQAASEVNIETKDNNKRKAPKSNGVSRTNLRYPDYIKDELINRKMKHATLKMAPNSLNNLEPLRERVNFTVDFYLQNPESPLKLTTITNFWVQPISYGKSNGNVKFSLVFPKTEKSGRKVMPIARQCGKSKNEVLCLSVRDAVNGHYELVITRNKGSSSDTSFVFSVRSRRKNKYVAQNVLLNMSVVF